MFFVVVFLIAGTARPDYDPLRHPVSSLSLTGAGWVQTANFLICGVLLLAFAVGVQRMLRRSGGGFWPAVLLAAVAVGLIGAGLFPTDPVNGYPPGPSPVGTPTPTGTAHNLLSTLVFVGLPAACFVFARRFAITGQRGWAGYSLASGIVFSVAFVLTSAGFRGLPALAGVAGLLQRTTLIVGFGWLAALAVHLLSRSDALAGSTAPDAAPTRPAAGPSPGPPRGTAQPSRRPSRVDPPDQ